MKNPFSSLYSHQKNFLWYYNANQEQEWNENTFFPFVTDIYQLELVKQQEQQLLFLASPEDTVLFRYQPDESYIEYLKNKQIKLPRIKIIQSLEDATAESKKFSDAAFIPYIQTAEIAEIMSNHHNAEWSGNSPELVKQINNKYETRKLAVRHGFNVTQGFFCRTTEELIQAYERLRVQGFDSCVLKIPYGSSGKGLRVIHDKQSFYSLLKYIAKRTATFELLLEGWYCVKQNMNCQLWIDASGPEILAITEQSINSDGVYMGTNFMPVHEPNIIEEYRNEMLRLGQLLKDLGYMGICGVDSILDVSRKLYPIVEINARFTQVTFLIPLIEKLAGQHCFAVSRFTRFETAEKKSFQEVLDVLHPLLAPDEQNCFFVYTFGSYKVPDQQKVLYRIFILFYGSNKEKVTAMSQYFQQIPISTFL